MAVQTVAIPLGYGEEGEGGEPLPIVPNPTGTSVVAFRVGGDSAADPGTYFPLLELTLDPEIITESYSYLGFNGEMAVSLRLSDALEDEQKAVVRLRFDYPGNVSLLGVRYLDNGFGIPFLTFHVPFSGGAMPVNSFAVFLADDTPAGPFWEKFTRAHEVA